MAAVGAPAIATQLVPFHIGVPDGQTVIVVLTVGELTAPTEQ